MYIYPLPLGLSSHHPLPIRPPPGRHRALGWAACATAASRYVYTWSCTYVKASLPILPNSPSPSVYTSLFSLSAALLLPCRQIHQYHFSRFHTCALVYDTCFPLFVLRHSVQQTLGPSTFTFKEREWWVPRLCENESVSCSVVSVSMCPHGL